MLSLTILLSTNTPWIFLNIIGVTIVFGGIFTSLLIMQPFSQTIELIKRLSTSIYGYKYEATTTVLEVLDLAYRHQNNLNPNKSDDEILSDGVDMMTIGLNSEDIKKCIDLRVENFESQLTQEAGFLISLSKLGPAFGLVGTLLGMIILLKDIGNLQGDISSVGPAMAIALCATLYGVATSNMLFIPWAEYLNHIAHSSILRGQIISEGLYMISEGRHPIQIRETLKSYLNKKEQNVLEEKLSVIENHTINSEDNKVA
ncbi:MAG: MotA/TolQ/ExbB proton channel family protein [Bdellovibrionaceae bacterium]|nr:MotA/TolQ/ExbB proton channel family protein [Pseudobdellovibrionaceae bacterium]